jgi:hypothetical protein
MHLRIVFVVSRPGFVAALEALARRCPSSADLVQLRHVIMFPFSF